VKQARGRVVLLPPRLYEGSGAFALLVPILIIAAGQLAGSLTWLAISGEDAPDLIGSAPVTTARVLRAKTDAVMGAIAIVFGPSIVGLAVVAPISALVTALAVAIAAASATLIQFWFSVQAKRSHFRRRQTSSRIATFAEALSSFSWAGVGALAAARTWLAIIPGLIGLAIVACAWIINPAKSTTLDAGRPRRNEPLEVSQAELKPSLSMAMFTGG
jgi:ABC-2 type transport system permease protein